MYPNQSSIILPLAKKQQLLVSLLVTPLIIYLIFFLFSSVLDETLTFFSGAVVLFILLGILFPLYLIGWKGFKEVITPVKPSLLVIFLVSGAIIMTAYSAPEVQIPNFQYLLLWILIGLTDGFAYEVYYRGLFMHYFADRPFIQVIVSSAGMALLSAAMYPFILSKSAFSLYVFSIFSFSVFQAIITKQSGNAFWSIFVHTFLAVGVLFL